MGAQAAPTGAAATDTAATDTAATDTAATDTAATDTAATDTAATDTAVTDTPGHRLHDLAAAVHAEPIQRIVAAILALDGLRSQLSADSASGHRIAAGIADVTAQLEGTVELLRRLVDGSLRADAPLLDRGVQDRNAGTVPEGTHACRRSGREEAGKPKARTIVVCDNHRDLRRAVVSALAELGGFLVVGQAWDAHTCLEEVTMRRPDLLILDVGLPGGGPALASAVRVANPSTRIVVFSGHDDDGTRQAMLAAGADRYVVKTGRLRALIQVLDDVC